MSPQRNPVILGVDPGSRVTGYAFLRAKRETPVVPGDLAIIDAGVLRAPVSLDIAVRIGLLHEALHELMCEHKPTVLVLEKAFCDRNVATAMKLGEMRGAYFAAAARCGVPIEEITPAEVKKTITGNGRADKDLVSAAIKTLAGFDRGNLPHDVTDALAIGYSFGLSLAVRWAAKSVSARMEATR